MTTSLHSFDIDAFTRKFITEREENLLKTDLESYHEELSGQIKGRSLLVIGGAGSIGAAFIKAILPYKPASLYIIDYNENGLTELTRDLRSSPLPVPPVYKSYAIDFGAEVFRKIWKREGPFQIVANFAAHKHVRSEKDHYSIEAMIRNNVISGKMLLDMMTEQPPERFFSVSTDKAANPVSVMGATKKLMEGVIRSYSNLLPVVTARFANVAFSNGSLLDGFLKRIARKQPLSAPSDVRRYFVSHEEAGAICLLSCIFGNSGEILFPKLKEDSMKNFSEIAENLLSQFGYSPHRCSTQEEAIHFAQHRSSNDLYPVYFFQSYSSGEKAFEEFHTAFESIDWERFENLGVIIDQEEEYQFQNLDLKYLEDLLSRSDLNKQLIVNWLQKHVPTFAHLETGLSLDQKM